MAIENQQAQINACNEIIGNQAYKIKSDLQAWIEMFSEHRIPFTEEDVCNQTQIRKKVAGSYATMRRVMDYLERGHTDVATFALKKELAADE